MRKEEFTSLCRRAASGDAALVQNLDLLYTGQVVACHEHTLTVAAFGHRHDWAAERCRQVDGKGDPLGPPTSL